jgi:hypothetical protein
MQNQNMLNMQMMILAQNQNKNHHCCRENEREMNYKSRGLPSLGRGEQYSSSEIDEDE